MFIYYVYKFNVWWRTSIRFIKKNTSNLLIRLIFTKVDVIRVKVRKIRVSKLYFSLNILNWRNLFQTALINWQMIHYYLLYYNYLWTCLILIRMHSHYENKISSDGAYFNDLLGLLSSRRITIRCKRSYLWQFFIPRIMYSHFEKKIHSDGANFHGICLGYWFHGVSQ